MRDQRHQLGSSALKSQERRGAVIEKVLITPSCLDDLHKHIAYKGIYDRVIDDVMRHDQTSARHAVRGGVGRFKVFESTITGDLRLCWSYAKHVAEEVLILWALDGHDSVFRRLRRLTGERFREVKFMRAPRRSEEASRVLVGDPEFAWYGARPPSFLELKRDKVKQTWVSEHLALSDEQSIESLREAIDGPMLLSGGGGSGKTTLLINLLLKQIQKGERPLLVTYHAKLAEYCKRLVGDGSHREEAIKAIKTIDELLDELLVKLKLEEERRYLSQEESRELFVRMIPAPLRDAAWAEFRGMWKGRMDVDAYTAHQDTLRKLEAEHARCVNLWHTAEGALISLDDRSKLSKQQQKQLEREEYWRAHPKYKIPNETPREAQERQQFYKRDRKRQQAEEQRHKTIACERDRVKSLKRAYQLSSSVYSRDVRFLNQPELIKAAIKDYEGAIEQRGDRLNASLEVLTRAHLVDSSYTSLLIDEAQDFTQLELQLLSLFVPDPWRWVVAGDENQIVNPSGFRWERVKDVMWWSANRLRELKGSEASQKGWSSSYLPSSEVGETLGLLKPTFLSVNYRNPQLIRRFAQKVLTLKRARVWEQSDELTDELQERGEPVDSQHQAQQSWAHEEVIYLDVKRAEVSVESIEEEKAEDHPWAWQAQSVCFKDRQHLIQHVLELSQSVPSFCLIVFSQEEREVLVSELKASLKGELEIDFERVFTPLEVKGLEFDLVLSLSPPLPQSEIEGIRDFEYNQIYVSATRARTSLAYLWPDPQDERAFLRPFCADQGLKKPMNADEELTSDDLIVRATWGRLLKISHLHNATERDDWARSAEQRAREGRHKLAAELYRVGGYHRESAALLEGLGELEGAIRDYRNAGLEADILRCEAKLAEQKGQLAEAHEVWVKYGALSDDFEGVWRTLSGAISKKSALLPLAQLIASPLSQRAYSLSELAEGATLKDKVTKLSEEALRLRFKGHDLVIKRLGELEKNREQEIEPTEVPTILARLRQSPRLNKLKDVARRSERTGLSLERLPDEESHLLLGRHSSSQKNRGPFLSLSDLELLLGVMGAQDLKKSFSELSTVSLRGSFRLPWSALPRAPEKLFSTDSHKGLDSSKYDKFQSIPVANHILRSMEARKESRQQMCPVKRGILMSYQEALHQWPELQQNQQRSSPLLPIYRMTGRELIRLERAPQDKDKDQDKTHEEKEREKKTRRAEERRMLEALITPKAVDHHQWDTQLKRAYLRAGLKDRLTPEQKPQKGDQEYKSDEAYTSWENLNSALVWREGIQRLIFLMSHLRLSHEATRLRAAKEFAEHWLRLTFDLVGHWATHSGAESFVHLEDEVIERLCLCAMSELKEHLRDWEKRTWREVTARPLSSQKSSQKSDSIPVVQGAALQHLMGLWIMAQALFLRGTWVSFINENLKAARSLEGFAASFIKSAHAQWIGLTLLPLSGLLRALEQHERRVMCRVEEQTLHSTQEQHTTLRRHKEIVAKRQKKLKGDLKALRKELKSLSKEEEGAQQARERELVEEQLKLLSAELEELERSELRLTDDELKSQEEIDQAQQNLEKRLLPAKRLRAQNLLLEWIFTSAELLQQPHPLLHDPASQGCVKQWRNQHAWASFIFKVGARELAVFFELLNRYRAAREMPPFRAKDFELRWSDEPQAESEDHQPSVWLQVMGGMRFRSPLEPFEQRIHLKEELPPASVLLNFSIEQGYTPLALELLEDKYYVEQVERQLDDPNMWSEHNKAFRESIRREINVLRAIPQVQNTRWLKSAVALTHENALELLLHGGSKWSQKILKRAAEQSEVLPEMIARATRELLVIWEHLTNTEQRQAREHLTLITRLWPSPLSEAITGLLGEGGVECLIKAYDGGERWLLLSSRCAHHYHEALINDQGDAHALTERSPHLRAFAWLDREKM